jgi:L-ectoine synthase
LHWQVVKPMATEGSGKIYKIETGDVYVLNGHEAHYLRGGPDGAQMICVFTPPCTGDEVTVHY